MEHFAHRQVIDRATGFIAGVATPQHATRGDGTEHARETAKKRPAECVQASPAFEPSPQVELTRLKLRREIARQPPPRAKCLLRHKLSRVRGCWRIGASSRECLHHGERCDGEPFPMVGEPRARVAPYDRVRTANMNSARCMDRCIMVEPDLRDVVVKR